MDGIERAIRSADGGSMRALTDIAYETVDTDPHLASVLQKRFGAVSVLPIEVRQAKREGIDKGRAKEYAEIIRGQLGEIPFFRNNIRQMAWGLFHGRMAQEIHWEMKQGDGAQLKISKISRIHARRLSFGPKRELRLQNEEATSVGRFSPVGLSLAEEDLRAERLWRKFVIWTPSLFDEYPEREGLAPRCLYWSFMKRFAARERMILMELFGKPWRIITIDPESPASKEDLDDALDAVDALGDTYTARMPQGTNLNVEKPAERAARTHKEVVEDSDKQLSKLVLGQTGTTDGVPAGLNSNQAAVMSDEQMLILAHDAFAISEVIKTYVSDAFIEVNFGAEALSHAPDIVLRADRPADRNTEIVRLQGSLNAGLEVDLNEAYEVAGFARPEDGVPLLKVEQPPPPPNSPNPPAPRPVIVYPKGETPEGGEQLPPAPSVKDDEPVIPDQDDDGGEDDNDVQDAAAGDVDDDDVKSAERRIRLSKILDEESLVILLEDGPGPMALETDEIHEQPSTDLGSPEDLIQKGRSEIMRASGAWANEVSDAIKDIENPSAIVKAINRVFEDIDTQPYARALERRMVHGAALGAMDNALDIDDIDVVKSANTNRGGDAVTLTAFSEKAYKTAIDEFLKKGIVSKATWNTMRAEIKRKSFTVAGIESQVMRTKIFESLAREIEKGADLRAFRKIMVSDLQAAGIIKSVPKRGVLSASHIDTVFRTNVLNSYNYGRVEHARQPQVLRRFPIWEIVSVLDGRSRDTHRAANGKMLLASDPFWLTAYPPFGFNCRCRVRSRPAKFMPQVVSGTTIIGLPDPGFTSGYKGLLAA
jgi:SPP1 gp7 family putative phage head morphogenesis protein